MADRIFPWRCHRSLIGDAFLVRGVAVTNILGLASSKPHTPDSMARVAGLEITCPAPDEEDAAAVRGRKEHKWN